MGKMGSNPFFFTRLLESLAGGGSPDGPMDGPSVVKTDSGDFTVPGPDCACCAE